MLLGIIKVPSRQKNQVNLSTSDFILIFEDV